jgi:hypothetical protein
MDFKDLKGGTTFSIVAPSDLKWVLNEKSENFSSFKI